LRPIGKGEPRITPRVSRFTRHVSRALPVLLSLGLASLAYLALRAWGMGYLYVHQPGAGLFVGNALQHALLVGRSVVRYLRLLIFPWGGISPIHHAELPLSATDPLNWLALLLTLGLLALLISAIYRARHSISNIYYPIPGLWLTFAVSLLPVVNLLPLGLSGGAFTTERFAYLPSFFFLAAVGAVIQTLRVSQTRKLSAVGALAVACLAGVLVIVPHWHDDVTLWTWASERAPQSDLPWANLAVQAGNRGEAELAIDYANRALTLNPDNANAHDTAGLALFLLGDYAGAEGAFRHALALEPDEAHVWSNLAAAVREQGRLDEALRLLIDEALARDPTLWTAHLGMGLVYLAGGRPDLAVEPLRQAVYYQPRNPEPWQHLVRALVAAGRGAEALETVARSPFASPATWFDLGNDLLAAGQAVEALQAYDRALAGTDPAPVHLQRGLAFVQLGDLERAQAALRAGLAVAPDDGQLLNNLGMVLRDQGDLDAALAAFQAAWQLLPDSVLVANNLAQTYQALGRADEAAQWQAVADQVSE
jgi:tetratricopeptide (TPR) repeat protein